MSNIARFYAEQLERWESRAYSENWGCDWLEEVGEAVRWYATECAARRHTPTFKGLMLYIARKADLTPKKQTC